MGWCSEFLLGFTLKSFFPERKKHGLVFGIHATLGLSSTAMLLNVPLTPVMHIECFSNLAWVYLLYIAVVNHNGLFYF